MDNFVNLHTHSTYSFLDGFGHPEQFIARVKELGQTAIAVTDHGNISSHYKWYEQCKAAGIKPILGIEFYITDEAKDKTDRSYYHTTVLAKNDVGYKNLIKLVSESYSKENFYYKPRIDFNSLAKKQEGLIITSSCPSGKTGSAIRNKQSMIAVEDFIRRELLRQSKMFKDYFVEFAPWNYEEGKVYGKLLYKIATELNLPMIITNDCHYPLKEQQAAQDVMLAIQTRTFWDDPKRMRFDQKDLYLKTRKEMEDSWNKYYPGMDCTTMLDNTVRIAEMVNFEFQKTKPIAFPYPEEKKEALLKAICRKGMELRGFTNLKNYEDRLNYELKLIQQKNFVDYFLVVIDLINWAKKRGIFVGPARGSSAGSLVCYVSKITEIDPLEHGLLFERFIDVNRSDLPDIDIDFEDERRDEVKLYLTEKYGENRVSDMAIFSTFKGRVCLQDVGFVFKVPYQDLNEVKKLVVQRSGGDSRASNTVEDTFKDFAQARKLLEKYPQMAYAKEIEGQIRQFGVHAAGTILSQEPIENFAAFYRASKGSRVCSMDYHDSSALGLLKIDLLGLNALTIIKRCLELIYDSKKIEIDWNKIPLDDKKTYDNFCKVKTFGVFQFDGAAVMEVCKQVQPKTFSELVDVNALSRPGTLHSGGTTMYVQRKSGKELTTFLHPLVEKITKDTFGITIYQEQVMKIVHEIGKLSWADTSAIRKVMSGRKGTEAFKKYEETFMKGAAENGLIPEIALAIWKQVFTHGSWSFNKSHSVSYTYLGYRMMWFKTNYPLEFYAALLEKSGDEDKVKRIVTELRNEKIKLYPVHVNNSKMKYSVETGGIRLGLQNIVGVGSMTAEKIVKHQPFISLSDFQKRTRIMSGRIIEGFLRSGAFKGLNTEEPGAHQQLLFGAKEVSHRDYDPESPTKEDLYKFCPMMVEDNIYQDWFKFCDEELDVRPLAIGNLPDKEDAYVTYLIAQTDKNKDFNPKNKIEEARSRGTEFKPDMGDDPNLYNLLNFNVKDETGFIKARLGYKIYPKFYELLWNSQASDVFLIKGMIRPGFRMIFVNEMIDLKKKKKLIDNVKARVIHERV